MKMKNKDIEVWERKTDYLATLFVYKYFGEDADYYWIGDDIGGVIEVNDYYFDLDRMREALKYGATKKKLFAYYDLELEMGMKKKFKEKSITEMIGVNFRNYLKMKNEIDK